MDSAGSFLPGYFESFLDGSSNKVCVDDLPTELGERTHHLDGINDLEVALFARLDWLLTGDKEGWHCSQLRIGYGCNQVGGARSQGGETNAGVACQAADGGCHEAGGLLMTSRDKLDTRLTNAFKECQIFFARNAKNVFDPLGDECLNKNIGSIGHVLSLAWVEFFAKKWDHIFMKGFAPALGIVGYISLFTIFITTASKVMPGPDPVWAPLVFLTIFCFSVMVCGLIVFYKPYMLFIDKKGKAAGLLVLSTAKWLGIFLLMIIGSVVIMMSW